MTTNLWVLFYFLCALLTMVILVIAYKRDIPILGYTKDEYYDYYDYYNDYYDTHHIKNKELIGVCIAIGLFWPLALANLIISLIGKTIKYIFNLIWGVVPQRIKDWLDKEA